MDPLGSTILSMQIIFDIGIEQPGGGFAAWYFYVNTKTGSYLLCDVSTSSAWHRDIILEILADLLGFCLHQDEEMPADQYY